MYIEKLCCSVICEIPILERSVSYDIVFGISVMNVFVVTCKSRFLFLGLVFDVRRRSEGIRKNIFFFYINTECLTVIVKVCGKKIRNTCSSTVSDGPYLYGALK